MFTDDQRVQIRLYMGMPRLFSQIGNNSILENAMAAIENLSGPAPNGDNGATEARIVTVLAQIDAINTQIVNNSLLMLATEVSGEVKYDAIRNDAGLRRVGRALISQLSIPLAMKPAVDFFSSSSINSTPDISLHDYS